MAKIFVSVPIELDDIAESLMRSHDTDDNDLTELICNIDAQIADAGFTERLIKSLLASLRGDLDDTEWATLADEIRDIKHVSYEAQQKARES